MLPVDLAGRSSWRSGYASKPDSTPAMTLSIRPITFRSKNHLVAGFWDRARRHRRKPQVVGVVRPPWSGREAMDEKSDSVGMEEKEDQDEFALCASWNRRD